MGKLQLSSQESAMNTGNNRESTFNNTIGSNHYTRKVHSPLNNMRQISSTLIDDSEGSGPKDVVSYGPQYKKPIY